jgi:hypothetical protein
LWPMGLCHVGLALLLRSSYANGVSLWSFYANSVTHANSVFLHDQLRSRYANGVALWSLYTNSSVYANSVFFKSAPGSRPRYANGVSLWALASFAHANSVSHAYSVACLNFDVSCSLLVFSCTKRVE